MINGSPVTPGMIMSLTQHVVRPLILSKTWNTKFLEGIGLRWKSTQTGDKTRFTPDAIVASLKLKLWWLVTEKGVAPQCGRDVRSPHPFAPARLAKQRGDHTGHDCADGQGEHTVSVAISATWRPSGWCSTTARARPVSFCLGGRGPRVLRRHTQSQDGALLHP